MILARCWGQVSKDYKIYSICASCCFATGPPWVFCQYSLLEAEGRRSSSLPHTPCLGYSPQYACRDHGRPILPDTCRAPRPTGSRLLQRRRGGLRPAWAAVSIPGSEVPGSRLQAWRSGGPDPGPGPPQTRSRSLRQVRRGRCACVAPRDTTAPEARRQDGGAPGAAQSGRPRPPCGPPALRRLCPAAAPPLRAAGTPAAAQLFGGRAGARRAGPPAALPAPHAAAPARRWGEGGGWRPSHGGAVTMATRRPLVAAPTGGRGAAAWRGGGVSCAGGLSTAPRPHAPLLRAEGLAEEQRRSSAASCRPVPRPPRSSFPPSPHPRILSSLRDVAAVPAVHLERWLGCRAGMPAGLAHAVPVRHRSRAHARGRLHDQWHVGSRLWQKGRARPVGLRRPREVNCWLINRVHVQSSPTSPVIPCWGQA